jgi:hypothetical protein
MYVVLDGHTQTHSQLKHNGIESFKVKLRPKVAEVRVSIASRVVNPKHDELRPAVSKEVCHYKVLKCPKYSQTQLSQL